MNYPCTNCFAKENCGAMCYDWKQWFKAVWRDLHRKYRTTPKEKRVPIEDIKSPCETCERLGCEGRFCNRWGIWFKEQWSELRRRYHE